MTQACIYIPKNTRNGKAVYVSDDCTFVVEVRRIAGCMRFEYLLDGKITGRSKPSCEEAWEEAAEFLCVPMIEMDRKTLNKTYKDLLEQYKGKSITTVKEKVDEKNGSDKDLPWK